MGKFSQPHITPTGLQSARREIFLSHLREEPMPYCRWIPKWLATRTRLHKFYLDQTTTPKSFLTANTVIQFRLYYSLYCFPYTRVTSRRKMMLFHRFSRVSLISANQKQQGIDKLCVQSYLWIKRWWNDTDLLFMHHLWQKISKFNGYLVDSSTPSSPLYSIQVSANHQLSHMNLHGTKSAWSGLSKWNCICRSEDVTKQHIISCH